MTQTAQKPTGRPRKGSVQDISARLLRAITRAEQVMIDPDITPELRLRAVHALSQASLNYTKITEVSELEARLAALEAAK